MANFTGDPQTAGQPLYSSWTPPTTAGSNNFSIPHRPGERLPYNDGRIYRYCLNGAVALVSGNCIQAPAQVAQHLALTPVAAAIGDTSLTVALGSTAASANQYAGGYAVISTGPGNGILYRIQSHPAAALSTSVVLKLDEPIQVALTTASRVDLQANPYSAVIQTPITTLTGAVVGVATHPLAANEYGWLQTHGASATLIQGTPAVGQSVSCPASAAGAAAINSGTLQIIGTMLTTGVDGKNNAVYLTID